MKKYIFIFSLLIVMLVSSVSFAETDNIDIYSPSGILIDNYTGKIIYEKNSNQRMYPASTTKIMTAILTLENCDDLSKTTVTSYDAVMSVPVGYADISFEIGEELTIEQLLNLLLIPSANIAGNILAEYIAGTTDKFVNLMNSKAIELGCKNTHFTNSYGLHSSDHYTTAYDLSLIARHAMKNEIFRKIVSKTLYSLPATNKYELDDRVYTTTNDLIKVNNNNRSDNYYYKYAIGIKTGYTSQAKNCVVGCANRDGLEVISVVLGGTQTEEGLSQRFLDSRNLFNYAFSNYRIRKLKEPNDIIKEIEIKGATQATKNLTIVIQDKIEVLIKTEDLEKIILPEINLNENLKGPIEKGEIVGNIVYTVDGISYTSNLLAESEVKKSPTWLFILEAILVLFIIFVILKKVKRKKR